MSETLTEALVGAGVLAVALGFGVYAAGFTDFGRSEGYELTASFRSAEGVSVGTDVRLAGVKVGTVTDMDLNPQTFRADTRFTVPHEVLLPEDTAAIIASEGLLGGNYVELRPGGSPFNIEPGSEIEDTQGAVSLITLLLRYVGGGEGEG